MNGLILYDNAVARDAAAINASDTDGTSTWMLGDENYQSYAALNASGGSMWVKFDFGSGSAVMIRGWAILNNDMEDNAGITTCYLKVGSADDGSTFDVTVDSFGVGSVSGCSPNVCSEKLTALALKRYWRVEFGNASDGLRVGEIMLFRSYWEFSETPDAPFIEDWWDQVAWGETEDGHDRTTRKGGVGVSTDLNWTHAGTTVRNNLVNLWDSERDLHPFVYADHRIAAASGMYPGCRCVRMPSSGPRIDEISPGELYDLSLPLEDVKTP